MPFLLYMKRVANERIQIYFPVLSVFLLALIVRLIYNFTAGHNYIPKDDAALYNNLANGT